MPNTVSAKWLITITVMLVAVAEVLDMTIVSVCLPHMMGSLEANTEQITWVLTSYIVAAAVTLPLTGFLIQSLGTKRLLLFSIIGFLFASVCCGLAHTLLEMVIFRVLQGLCGSTLLPLSQYVLRITFPPEEQNKALAIWGMGIMAGPVLGPTLGGYITEISNWRWIFYINVPICCVSFFMALRYIEETPIQKKTIDWVGMFLLSIGVGALQIFLDKGNTLDWFASPTILILALVAFLSLSIFTIRGWHNPHNIINLHLFKNYHFTMGVIYTLFFTMLVLGAMILYPLMLEQVLHYSALTTGWLMAPRGIATAFTMAAMGYGMHHFSLRFLIFLGVFLNAVGTLLSGLFTVEMSNNLIIWVDILQGIGIGLFFIPISAFTFKSLPESDVPEATGLFNFSRNLGHSIGIAVITALLSHRIQINWNHLIEHLNFYLYQPLQLMLQKNIHAKYWILENLAIQAACLSFIQVFIFIGIGLLVFSAGCFFL